VLVLVLVFVLAPAIVPPPVVCCRDQAVEIIVALKKLGEELTPSERHILETSDEAMKQFEIADKAIGECRPRAVVSCPRWCVWR
jgi:hypothetical protein